MGRPTSTPEDHTSSLIRSGQDTRLRLVDRRTARRKDLTAFGSPLKADWNRRFQDAWTAIQTFGFDKRFKHMWEYYLAYCEAGFLSGNIDVRQVVFAKSG